MTLKEETEVFLEQQKCYLPARFVLTFLLFWAMCLEYAHRVCLSVTIVAMVNRTAFGQVNSTEDIDDDTCEAPHIVNGTSPENELEGEYIWTPSTQGIILGAYFYGYVCTQVIGGRVSEVAGGKWPLGLSILCASILTLVTPVAANIGVFAIVIVRVLMGLVHGVCLPTVFAIFAQWSPVEERSTLISISMIGDHFGTIISMPLAAYLCQYGFAGGWPSVYYVLGTVGCIWFIIWICLAHSTPTHHPRISKTELTYIRRDSIQMTENQKLPIPWKNILTSLPVWSLAFSTFCCAWGFTTLLTKLPTYLQVVLHLPIQQNGLVNSLVYISVCITLFTSALAADYLRTKKHFSITKVRKGFQIFGSFGPALCMGLVPLVGCDRGVVIFLLTAAMAFQGMCGGGLSPVAADMAPHHAATVFGLVNGIGSTSGIFSPMVAGFLLEDAHSSVHQWSLVFFLSSGIYIVGGIAFLLFASADRQPWACVQAGDKVPTNGYPKPLTNESLSEVKAPKYGTISS